MPATLLHSLAAEKNRIMHTLIPFNAYCTYGTVHMLISDFSGTRRIKRNAGFFPNLHDTLCQM